MILEEAYREDALEQMDSMEIHADGTLAYYQVPDFDKVKFRQNKDLVDVLWYNYQKCVQEYGMDPEYAVVDALSELFASLPDDVMESVRKKPDAPSGTRMSQKETTSSKACAGNNGWGFFHIWQELKKKAENGQLDDPVVMDSINTMVAVQSEIIRTLCMPRILSDNADPVMKARLDLLSVLKDHIYREVSAECHALDARQQMEDFLEEHAMDMSDLKFPMQETDYRLLADRFETEHDCSCSDNGQWQELIEHYLTETGRI